MARALILALLALPAGPAWAGSPLLELLLRGTVLLLLVFAATWALRHGSAGLRHLLWSATLAGVLLLPLLGRSLPRLHVLPWSEATSVRADAAAPLPDAVPGATLAPATGAGQVEASSVKAGSQSMSASPAGTPAGSGRGWSFAALLLGFWGAGVLAFFGWIVAGALATRRIARRAEVATSPEWTRPLYEAADIMELPDAPRLLLSGDVQLPFTSGLLRPTVVLPRSAEEWSEDRRRVVLTHELAHVRRRDLVTHLLGRLACALYWFHPLVWLAARRARAEGERACDDLVLATGARASAYADHLLQIVHAARRTSAPVVAIPMAQRKEFEGRMLAILDSAPRRVGPGRLQAIGAVATLALVVAGVAAAAPVQRSERAERALTASPGAPASALREPGARPSSALPPAGQASAFLQDTGKARRSKEREIERDKDLGSLPAIVGDAVSGALAGLDLGDIVNQSVRGALGGFGGGTPMPMPTPAPAPMVFGGGRSSAPHIAGGPRHPRGHGGDPKVVAALIGALRDESAAVRGRAAYSLAQLEDPAAVAPLGAALRSDSDPEVRRLAAWALGSLDDSDGGAALGAALHSDANVEVRRTAAWALGSLDCAGQHAALAEAVQRDADVQVRTSAAWAMAECDAAAATPALAQALHDAAPQVRRTAAWALGSLEPDRAPAALIEALKDADPAVRRSAAWALGNIGDDAASPALAAALNDADPQLRHTALWAIGQTGGPAARDALLQAIKSNDPEIRRWAAAALAEMR